MTDSTIPLEPTAEQIAARNAAAAYKPDENPVNHPVGLQQGNDASNGGKPGYDVYGNPAPGTPLPGGGSAQPITGAVPSPTEYYSRITPVTPPAPVVAKTADEIQLQKMKDAQGLIDAINKQYDSQVEGQLKINQGRERGTNAVSIAAGLSGSSEAEVDADKTRVSNQKEVDAINNQRGLALAGVMSKISDAAVLEAKQSRDEARQSSIDQETYRAKAQEDAVNHITQLAQNSGITLAGLKASTTPDEYAYLSKYAGGDAGIQALITKNRPAETIIDKKIENGKYVIAYQDPLTKKVRIESTDLGVPDNYTKSFDLGDRLMIVPDNFDPKTDTPIYVSKGVAPKASTGSGSGTVKSGGLETTQEVIGQGASQLETSRGTDHYVDPSIYLDLYTQWTSNKGLPQDFVKYYPPNKYVNPSNKTLPPFLQNTTKAKSTTSGETNEDGTPKTD